MVIPDLARRSCTCSRGPGGSDAMLTMDECAQCPTIRLHCQGSSTRMEFAGVLESTVPRRASARRAAGHLSQE